MRISVSNTNVGFVAGLEGIPRRYVGRNPQEAVGILVLMELMPIEKTLTISGVDLDAASNAAWQKHDKVVK